MVEFPDSGDEFEWKAFLLDLVNYKNFDGNPKDAR